MAVTPPPTVGSGFRLAVLVLLDSRHLPGSLGSLGLPGLLDAGDAGDAMQ
jgi:hypothetical protein